MLSTSCYLWHKNYCGCKKSGVKVLLYIFYSLGITVLILFSFFFFFVNLTKSILYFIWLYLVCLINFTVLTIYENIKNCDNEFLVY